MLGGRILVAKRPTSKQAADGIVAFLMSMATEPWMLLLLINVAILFMGCVLETVPALVIALLLITYVGPLSTWLPSVLFAD